MDYQNLSYYQIKNLDYWNLVRALMEQISPETRGIILDRLKEMNDKLINGNHVNVQPDLSRAGMLNSRKKDITENKHPALDTRSYKGKNPVPLHNPVSANVAPQKHYNSSSDEIDIDLDDVIDEIISPTKEQSSLDNKLEKIKLLQKKFNHERRKRKH